MCFTALSTLCDRVGHRVHPDIFLEGYTPPDLYRSSLRQTRGWVLYATYEYYPGLGGEDHIVAVH